MNEREKQIFEVLEKYMGKSVRIAGFPCILMRQFKEIAKELSALNGWVSVEDRPKVICTIGSSRFCAIEAVLKWKFEKRGFICVGMHLLPDWYIKEKGWTEEHHGGEQEGVADIMDELHLRKIEMADKIFVVNHEGYIGERTSFELKYAKKLNKEIEYLEPIPPLPKKESK